MLVVLGGGIMDWTREGDQDKHVHLHSAYSTDGTKSSGGSGGGAVPSRPAELLNLASVLVRQSMPASYKVTTG